MAESFFNLLKRERIRRRKSKTRAEARQDVFDYIEFFYNPQRKHVRNGMLSPINFEQQQKLKLQGVQETRGYSTWQRCAWIDGQRTPILGPAIVLAKCDLPVTARPVNLENALRQVDTDDSNCGHGCAFPPRWLQHS